MKKINILTHFVFSIFLVSYTLTAFTLPLYSARGGRTCNNCHSSPKDWKNPDLKDRKCSLSCTACHVDPTGGGLRNVSGVFFAKATLPSTSQFYTPKAHHAYEYSIKPQSGESKKEAAQRINNLKTNNVEPLTNSENKPIDLAWSQPYLGSSPWAFDQSRYNGLNSDPMLRLGIDTRFTAWFPGVEHAYFFPMQFDTQVAFRPIAHTTLYLNSGVLAKFKGYKETYDQPHPYSLKDAFLLFSQLPYMAYVKVGSFIPAFGTRLDDHTSYIRKNFELNQDVLNSRVHGIEIGAAPNYPYLNMAVFYPNKKESLYDGDRLRTDPTSLKGVPGHGFAVNAGFRDVAAGAGVSYMTRRRELSNGGDTNSYSLSWYANPWFLWDQWPLTYMGEYSFGDYQRPISGQKVHQHAIYQELAYRYSRLINLKFKFDFSDPDFEIKENEEARYSVVTEFNFLTGLSLAAHIRQTQLSVGTSLGDFLFILRWYI